MREQTALAIRKSVTVRVPLETAFHVSTVELGSWWPLATKSVSPETAQEVDVRFATAEEGTRVELEHRGWERLVGPDGEIPSHFESGWDTALESYIRAAERSR